MVKQHLLPNKKVFPYITSSKLLHTHQCLTQNMSLMENESNESFKAYKESFKYFFSTIKI